MRILRRANYRRMPWKNGLGVTEEVIADPPESDIGNFGWRISIAHVGTDGPFSLFPGVDRTITLLDGGGLFLDLQDRTVELDRKGEPFAFAGELSISSRNKAGPTIDLNVMTRRGQYRHVMKRLDAGENLWRSGGETATVVICNAATTIDSGGAPIRLDRFDAVYCEPADEDLRLPINAELLAISLFPAG